VERARDALAEHDALRQRSAAVRTAVVEREHARVTPPVDCGLLAGTFRAELLAVLTDIGDDTLLTGQPEAKVRRIGLHGTAEQRKRWFLRGAVSGDPEACDTFGVPQP